MSSGRSQRCRFNLVLETFGDRRCAVFRAVSSAKRPDAEMSDRTGNDHKRSDESTISRA